MSEEGLIVNTWRASIESTASEFGRSFEEGRIYHVYDRVGGGSNG